MKRTTRRILMVVLALVFVGSLGMLAYRTMEYKEGEEIYAEAETLVDLPDLSDLPVPVVERAAEEVPQETSTEVKTVYVDPYADALRNMDFSALREVNSDVLGWIMIPGTVISYPLLQGTDNQYYLKHTWKKWTSAVGAIFLECKNSRDLSDFNTVIYGHRMNNGSMFASLKNYKKQSYWAAHPCVYITDDSGSHKYEIFAAYEVSTAGTTYQIGFSGDQSKQAFIDYCLEQSVIDTGIVPTVYDRILTLSTCTGNGHATRWVVQAVLKGVAPSDSAQEAQPETIPEQAAEPADVPEQPQEDQTANGEEPLPEEQPTDAPEQEPAPAPEEPTPDSAPPEEDGEAEQPAA